MDALLLGLSIGLAAGISPGPLLVLVVTSTLRSGWPAGALSACAPLISDLLVVGGVLLESRSAQLARAEDTAPGSSLRALLQAASPSPCSWPAAGTD